MKIALLVIAALIIAAVVAYFLLFPRNTFISFSKPSGVTVTFSRDARGKASLCVTGTGYTDEALRAIGEELSGRVVQHYVYQRLMGELRARHFNVVAEETDDNHAIHLKVRHWEN